MFVTAGGATHYSLGRVGVMNDGLLKAVNHTVAFLRMAAIELRRIAERTPDIAGEILHIAAQLEADADELEGRSSSAPPRRLN